MLRSRLIVMALAVLLVAGATAIADDERDSEPLAGTWWVKVEFEGVGIITYVAQYSKDGRMTAVFPSGPGGPDQFADTRSACPGEWRATGRRQYEVTQYCLWSAWDYGMVPDRIRSKLTLDKKGERFTQPFSYEYWDPSTQQLVLQGYGVSYGTRLHVVPYQ